MTVKREPDIVEREFAAADQLRAALSKLGLYGCHVSTESGWGTARTGRLSLLVPLADAQRLAELLGDAAEK